MGLAVQDAPVNAVEKSPGSRLRHEEVVHDRGFSATIADNNSWVIAEQRSETTDEGGVESLHFRGEVLIGIVLYRSVEKDDLGVVGHGAERHVVVWSIDGDEPVWSVVQY